MVAGRQAEVGVLEAPVLRSQRRKIPGAESLSILGSLGPLPPYAIFVKKSVSGKRRPPSPPDSRNYRCNIVQLTREDETFYREREPRDIA